MIFSRIAKHTLKVVIPGLVGVTALISSAFTFPAHAITFNLNPTLTDGTGSATGTISINDNLYVPNQDIVFPGNISGITDFNFVVTGLTTSPSSTTFTLSDLTNWRFQTDNNNNITALAFESNPNPDNYLIAAFGLVDIAIIQDGTPSASFGLNPTVETAIPFEFSPTLGLVILGGLFGARHLKKRMATNKSKNLTS